MRTYAREAGRDPVAIGIEGRVSLASQEPQDWRTQMQAWETLGYPSLGQNRPRCAALAAGAHQRLTAIQGGYGLGRAGYAGTTLVHDGGGQLSTTGLVD